MKKAPPPKTKGQLEREKYASAYDDLASKGVPEYAVYIKEAAASDTEWKFVGCMTVPRNAKVDAAIYENESNLVKGAYKLHPKLVGKSEFTYGYNLKKFPDEPIKVKTHPPTHPLQQQLLPISSIHPPTQVQQHLIRTAFFSSTHPPTHPPTYIHSRPSSPPREGDGMKEPSD